MERNEGDLEQQLRSLFGTNAKFREGQKEAIDCVLKKKRVLVVERTGWGKSLVYFLATKIMRKRGEGVTIIISPLLALMRNQINSVRNYNLHAECINSEENNTLEEMNTLVSRCNNGQCDIIFVTPERLDNADFLSTLATLRIGMLVVDEAHCISDWGHDFRPDYRRINQLIRVLPSNIAILATTATATNQVMQDIKKQIGDCEIIRGPLVRESLRLHKVYMPNSESKYAWLAKNIPNLEGSGIIYATTIKECEKITNWLQANRIQACAYHSRLSKEDKLELEERLQDNQIKVLVSTIALGMGFDKADLSFIIHYYTPKSIVEYYQQIGRAGRAIDTAICILLYGDEAEKRINKYFIQSSFPSQEHFNTIIECIANKDNITETSLLQAVNVKHSTIRQILKLLSLDGIIGKSDRYYYRTTKPYIPQTSYYESIIKSKENDYNELINYQQTTRCLMAYLTNALDDPYTKKCGRCSNCMGNWTYTDDIVSQQHIQNVKRYFEHSFNLLTVKKRSSITNRNLGYRCTEGLALSYYHETLGQEASKCKYVDGIFSDLLVDESVKKLTCFLSKKNIQSKHIIIVPIPSNRRPTLVPEFAKKVAKKLGAYYYEALAKKPNEPEQKTMLNSSLQEKNVRDYLFIQPQTPVQLGAYHVLLIDDFVDSGWTFAVAADILGQKFNCQSIIPFALSITGQSD